MKKFLAMVAVLFSAGIMAVFFVGCGAQTSPDPENCEALIETNIYANISECNDFIAICTSPEEFRQQCLTNGYDFFDSENSKQNMYDAECGELVRQLSADEFEDYALVVCAFYLPSYAGQHLIEDVEVQDGQLTMYVRRPRSNAADDVTSYAFLVAQVESSFVSGVEQAEYVFC